MTTQTMVKGIDMEAAASFDDTVDALCTEFRRAVTLAREDPATFDQDPSPFCSLAGFFDGFLTTDRTISGPVAAAFLEWRAARAAESEADRHRHYAEMWEIMWGPDEDSELPFSASAPASIRANEQEVAQVTRAAAAVHDYYVAGEDEHADAMETFSETPSLQALAVSLRVAGDEWTRDALASVLAQVGEGVSIAFGAAGDFENADGKYSELIPILVGLLDASEQSREAALSAFADWQAKRMEERQKRDEAYAAAGV